jgi:hypothetical protein
MLAALAVGAAVSAPALLTDPDLMAALGRIDPSPGAWVEYLVRSEDRGEARLRVTALAAVSTGSYWLEVAAVSGSGTAAAVRLLVREDAGPPSGVERLYAMVAGQQPIEIPLDRLGPAREAPPGHGAKRIGAGSVRVPAGNFTAEILRVCGTRIWRDPSVPLWGLVKARSPRASVELLAFGISGGHSVFPPGWDQGKGSERAK